MKNEYLAIKIDNTKNDETGESVYYPVCVDIFVYSKEKNRALMSVGHYGVQNGDAMRDPEMVFLLRDDLFIPISYQNDFHIVNIGGIASNYYDESLPKGNAFDDYISLMIDGNKQQSFNFFVNTWIKNIVEQQELKIK